MELKHYRHYCEDIENVENFEKAKKDNFKGWDCHHRLETHNSDGERREVNISRKELIAIDMYYNRPAEELIFLTTKEHYTLHYKGKQAWNKGKSPSEKARKKMSDAKKDVHWYNNGKENKFCFECPEGFVPGRIYNTK